jgi:hypothetical protein
MWESFLDEFECEAHSRQHHYARGSVQREQLTAALESFQKKTPLQIPIVVGGKEVSLASTLKLTSLLIPA